MGTKRLAMRPCREIMRLKYEAGLGHRAIARAWGIGEAVSTRSMPATT